MALLVRFTHPIAITLSPVLKSILPNGNFITYYSPSHTTGSGSKSTPSKVPPISHLSAVWPGVIFPSLGKRTSKHTSTQTTTHPPTSVLAASHKPGANVTESATPTMLESTTNDSSMVQNQLAIMTNMCSELLQGQNCLISTLCHRLDNAEARVATQEHMNQLHDYHGQLQLYYENMCQAHAQVT